MRLQNWVIDYRGEYKANMYRIVRTVVDARSKYQDILIAETPDFGRALFLDGNPQSSALDEHIYHETLLQPALFAHEQPKTVFIAGGGEGAPLREVLKHNTIERVVMVDIDELMVDMAKEHLAEWHQGAFEDARVQVLHEDARAYLAGTDERFDCIFMDAPDPTADSPAALLFTTEFFTLIQARLNAGGTFAMQAEGTGIGTHDAHISIVKTLQQHFQTVLPYQMTIPFFGLPWGFVVASDIDIKDRFTAQTLAQTQRARNCTDLKFYDAETHQHMFSLPKHIRKALEDPDTGIIVSDKQILVVD